MEHLDLTENKSKVRFLIVSNFSDGVISQAGYLQPASCISATDMAPNSQQETETEAAIREQHPCGWSCFTSASLTWAQKI